MKKQWFGKPHVAKHRRPRQRRVTGHIEDPVPERVCPFCTAKCLWPLSATKGGQIKTCRCGATFSAWRPTQWLAP